MLDQTLKIAALYDFYGSLLTDRQQKALEMHYLEDMSLSEVAQEFSVSRQAVHDILRRAVQTMQEFDDKLLLVERHDVLTEKAVQIDKLLEQMMQGSKNCRADIGKIRSLLKDISSY